MKYVSVSAANYILKPRLLQAIPGGSACHPVDNDKNDGPVHGVLTLRYMRTPISPVQQLHHAVNILTWYKFTRNEAGITTKNVPNN